MECKKHDEELLDVLHELWAARDHLDNIERRLSCSEYEWGEVKEILSRIEALSGTIPRGPRRALDDEGNPVEA